MELTTDQLTYILERKYTNIRIGSDVMIVCTVQPQMENGSYIQNKDAHIIEWHIPQIPQPTVDEIERLWDILKDQYNSDPARPDSEMYHILRAGSSQGKMKIKVNPDL